METETLMVDLKLKGVEISLDTAESIIAASMLEQYYHLKKDIEFQKNIKNPLEYQKEDLKDDEKLLDATETMLKHYTARSHWPEELMYEDDEPANDDVCCTLLDLSETLRAENNNAENSRSNRGYNEDLIDAVTMIVSYYDSLKLKRSPNRLSAEFGPAEKGDQEPDAMPSAAAPDLSAGDQDETELAEKGDREARSLGALSSRPERF